MRAFIIMRDRVTYARQCAQALAAAGCDVAVVDHGSTWPAALGWLQEHERHSLVLRRGPGIRPQDMWLWEPFRQACGSGRYIVTDPDVIPSEDCPGDWVEYLSWVLDNYDRPKAGLGLRIDRIPDHYQRRAKVLEYEQKYWDHPLGPGVYEATIDITLAMYRPLAEQPDFTPVAMRTGHPYVADHVAWHEDLENLSPELAYYHDHAEQGVTFWTTPGRSPFD